MRRSILRLAGWCRRALETQQRRRHFLLGSDGVRGARRGVWLLRVSDLNLPGWKREKKKGKKRRREQVAEQCENPRRKTGDTCW